MSCLTPTQLEPGAGAFRSSIGGALALYALYLRRGIAETEAFEREGGPAAEATERGSLLVLLISIGVRCCWRIGISVGGTVAFYTFTIYLQKFMVNTTGFSRDPATLIATVGARDLHGVSSRFSACCPI